VLVRVAALDDVIDAPGFVDGLTLVVTREAGRFITAVVTVFGLAVTGVAHLPIEAVVVLDLADLDCALATPALASKLALVRARLSTEGLTDFFDALLYRYQLRAVGRDFPLATAIGLDNTCLEHDIEATRLPCLRTEVIDALPALCVVFDLVADLARAQTVSDALVEKAPVFVAVAPADFVVGTVSPLFLAFVGALAGRVLVIGRALLTGSAGLDLCPGQAAVEVSLALRDSGAFLFATPPPFVFARSLDVLADLRVAAPIAAHEVPRAVQVAHARLAYLPVLPRLGEVVDGLAASQEAEHHAHREPTVQWNVLLAHYVSRLVVGLKHTPHRKNGSMSICDVERNMKSE